MKVAFGYKMGSGKDTVVDYLIQQYGGVKISFASPIYDIQKYAQERCGFKVEKDRKFLQYIGTEWARSKDPNVWIRLALESVPKEGNVFLSDLRFPNEMKALKERNWICIKLVRDIQLIECKGTGDTLHESEIILDEAKWDYVIYNSGTLEDLYRKIDNIFLEIQL